MSSHTKSYLNYGAAQYDSDVECSGVTIEAIQGKNVGIYLQPLASIPACCIHKQRRLMFGNSRTPLIQHVGAGPSRILSSW
jgi:hypothetical protein